MNYQFWYLDDSDEQNENERALELKFTMFYNSSAMTEDIHNLTIKMKEAKTTKEIFYPKAHTGVYIIMKLMDPNFYKVM